MATSAAARKTQKRAVNRPARTPATTSTTPREEELTNVEASRKRDRKAALKTATSVMKIISIAVLFFGAQFGLFIRQDIWAPSIWWLLPLIALLAPIFSAAWNIIHVTREGHRKFRWRRFWRQLEAQAPKELARRKFSWIVAAVLFVSFLFFIFSRFAEMAWWLVHDWGFGAIALEAATCIAAMLIFWRLVAAAKAKRFAWYKVVKIVIWTALLPVFFLLPAGLSITVNSGF